jgi:glucose uptake protein GlcU
MTQSRISLIPECCSRSISRVRFSFDGTPLEATRGMTIGGALLANGIVSWRLTPPPHQ